MAVVSYLQKNVPAFGPEIITEKVLIKLLNNSWVLKLKANNDYLTLTDKLIPSDEKMNKLWSMRSFNNVDSPAPTIIKNIQNESLARMRSQVDSGMIPIYDEHDVDEPKMNNYTGENDTAQDETSNMSTEGNLTGWKLMEPSEKPLE